MKTQEFLNLLEEHSNKSLLFEYTPGKLVDTNYHITEVKHITIDSVDCGSQTDAWKETIIQLWESPLEKGKSEYMSALKALGILKKVGQMKPYTTDAEVKIEYSNSSFHTAQLFVNDFEIQDKHLIFKLAIQKTDCKAKQICGVPEKIVNIAEKIVEKTEACCEFSALPFLLSILIIMKNILVLCTGNSCRSQMAHGYLKTLSDNRTVNVYSAGIETHGLNPGALAILKEDGLDISHHSSNHVDEYQNINFDYIITVCDHANENCPFIPSKNAKRLHQNFFDPSKVQGSEDEKHAAFLKARNEIKTYCKAFVEDYLA